MIRRLPATSSSRAGRTIDLAASARLLARAGLARQTFPEHLVVVEDLPRVPSARIGKDVLRVRARQIAAAEDERRAQEERR